MEHPLNRGEVEIYFVVLGWQKLQQLEISAHQRMTFHRI